MVSWYSTDLQGSVRAVLDNSGSITSAIAYDAFGNVTSGTPPDRFGFAMMQRDSITLLSSAGNGTREFGATGFWLQEDPIGLRPDSNPRRYVGNSPTNFVDPSGLEDILLGTVFGHKPTPPKPSLAMQLWDGFSGLNEFSCGMCPMLPNWTAAINNANPIYLYPYGTNLMQSIHDFKGYTSKGADPTSSALLAAGRNGGVSSAVLSGIDIYEGKSSSPDFIGGHDEDLDTIDYIGRGTHVLLSIPGGRVRKPNAAAIREAELLAGAGSRHDIFRIGPGTRRLDDLFGAPRREGPVLRMRRDGADDATPPFGSFDVDELIPNTGKPVVFPKLVAPVAVNAPGSGARVGAGVLDDVIAHRVIQRGPEGAGFADTGPRIIVDSNLPPQLAAELRARGHNARHVSEIFDGIDPRSDVPIRSVAERFDARVLTKDRGRDAGGGFGDRAINVDGSVRLIPTMIRILETAPPR